MNPYETLDLYYDSHEDYLEDQYHEANTLKTYTCSIGLISKHGCASGSCEECEYSQEEDVFIG